MMRSDTHDVENDNREDGPLEKRLEDIEDTSPGNADKTIGLSGQRSANAAAEDLAAIVESSSQTDSPNDKYKPWTFRCVTDESDSANIHSARAGHIRTENGRLLLPRWKPGAVITYTIDVESFPSRKSARFARRALFYATSDWNGRKVGVQFQRVNDDEPVVFTLKYHTAPYGFFAESFFPDSRNRTLYIFKFAFRKKYRKFMANVFRHELGHVLGLRHEEAEFTESKLPSIALTPANTQSVMRSFTDPSSLCIQDSDVAAVKKLSAIQEEDFAGFKVITVDPETLAEASFSGSDRLSSRDSDLASTESGGSNSPSTEQQQPQTRMERRGSLEVTPNQTESGDIRMRIPTITIDPPQTENEELDGQPKESAPQAALEQSVPETAQLEDLGSLSVPPPSDRTSPPPDDEELPWPRSDQQDTKHDPEPMQQLDVQDALTPEAGTEDTFLVNNNPFAFSPGQLNKLFHPTSHSAFYALGGLRGLEIGLRTDRTTGLSLDEVHMDGMVTFEEAASKGVSRYGELGEKAPESTHREHRTPDAPHDPTRRNDNEDHGTGYIDRKRVFKSNRIPEAAKKSLFRMVRDVYCGEWLLVLLTIAAIASSAWGMYESIVAPSQGRNEPNADWVHGVAILVGISVIIGMETLYQWTAQRRVARQKAMRECRTARIVRSGRTVEVDVIEILVGDVVLLAAGDIVPVDGILIDGYGLECDESNCTGESDVMKKVPGDQVFTALDDAVNGSAHHVLTAMNPFIMSGSKVLGGTGSYIVTAVGIHSTYGQLRMLWPHDKSLGPYKRRLQDLSTTTRRLGIAVGILLFTVCTIKLLATLPSSALTAEQKGRNFLNMLVLVLALSVAVAVPFLSHIGSLTTTIMLARLREDNTLIRYNKAWETAAGVTTVCTGKTGVLTQNRTTVVAVTLGSFKGFGNQHEATVLASTGQGNDVPVDYNSAAAFADILGLEEKNLLLGSIAVNSTAYQGVLHGQHTFMGSKTEVALLDFGREVLGLDSIEDERRNAGILDMLPFATDNQFMATMVRLPGGAFRVFVKGAPEVLLKRCSEVVSSAPPNIDSLSTLELTNANRELYWRIVGTYGSRSLRPLLLCFRDFDYRPSLAYDTALQGMTFLAVVGMKDPLRNGAPDAVRECHRAGITVRMVTGDNVETARAVAQEIGILRNDSIVMQGPEFRRLDDRSQCDVLPRLRVLARASPKDKTFLVQLLHRQGERVAVTGGNGSDAIALKLAEVGFAKGISGTDTAIEASDVILMDDSFSSMVKCIFWSRAAKDSHAKALQYRLAAVATASVLTFCTATATDLSDSPVLNAVQLLWVALVTSVSPFAFLARLLTEAIRHQQPSPKATPIITLTMQKMVMGQTISQLVITLLAYFGCVAVFGIGTVPPSTSDQSHRNTFVFNTFVWLQIFNIVNSQRLDNKLNIFEGASRHSFFLWVAGLIASGQVLIVFIGGKAFKVVPLDGREWVISIVLGTTSLLSGALLRLLPDFLIDNLTPASIKRRSRGTPSPTVDLEDTNGDWN